MIVNHMQEVRTFMIKDPVILDESDSIKEAFLRISNRGIGRVIVGKNPITGIVSTRDLIAYTLKSCGKCSQLDMISMLSRSVDEIMTRNPVTVMDDEDLMDALVIMVTRNFGSLPVVDYARRPVGMIVERDLLIAFQEMERILPVSQFMTKSVTTIGEHEMLISAAEKMVRRGFRRLPVVDSTGKVVGIVTAYDVLRTVVRSILKADPQLFLSSSAKDVMTKEIEVVDPEASVNEAAAKLLLKRIGSLLVLDSESKPLGIVTERDLLIALYHQINLKAMRKE